MNTALLLIILIPLAEIYLFIKIGSQIGALNTVMLILVTAVVGVWYAKYEGLNNLKSGMGQLVRNEIPLYEIISGAAIALAAVLLILPGFATDIFGLLLIVPFTRRIIISSISSKLNNKNSTKKDFDYIDGESEDINNEDKK